VGEILGGIVVQKVEAVIVCARFCMAKPKVEA
jgi:hypothetical protein